MAEVELKLRGGPIKLEALIEGPRLAIDQHLSGGFFFSFENAGELHFIVLER